MTYTVLMRKSAARELAKFPKTVQQRIMDRIVALTDDARPAGSEKMAGHDRTHKIRVGDYRAVYVSRQNRDGPGDRRPQRDLPEVLT